MKKIQLKFTSFKDIKKVFVSNIPFFLIIAVLSIAVFINGVNGEFVSDDIPGIVNNPRVQNLGLALKNLGLQSSVWAFIYTFFGANEVPFHLLSLGLHILDVSLFFLIIYNLFSKKTAAIASILFVVHPLVSETVLWISAVNYLWNTLFLFISVLLYLLFKKTGEKKYLWSIFGLFIFLTFTFSNFWILIIPIFLAALDFFLLQQKNNLKFMKFLLPLFGLAVLTFLYFGQFKSGVTVGQRIESLQTPESTPYFNRLPYSFYMTGELLVFPKNLTLYHEGEQISEFKLQLMAVITVIFLLSMLYLWFKNKNRKIIGLIALIYISILPVFSPLQVAWFTAERYLYPAVGLFTTLLALLFLKLDKKASGQSLAIILTVILTLVYSGRSFARTFDWKTRKSVWLSTAEVSPYSSRVHNNLGDVYGIEGDWQRSVYHFQTSIQLKPNYAEAMHNLGNTYMLMGDLENAKKWLENSLQFKPNLYQAWHKLGLIEYNLGNPDLAKQHFEQSIRINPQYTPAIQALQALQQKSQ